MLQLPVLKSIAELFGLKMTVSSHAAPSASLPTDLKDFKTMVTEMKNNFSADPSTVAGEVNFAMTEKKNWGAKCYGPSIDVSLDNNSTYTNSNNNTDDADHNLPGGDVGIWATSEDDGTACAAAQITAVTGYAKFPNDFIKGAIATLSAAGGAGKGLPAAGETIDVAANAPPFPGVTITSATLARLADRTDGNKVYKFSLAFTATDGKTGSVTVYHTPLAEDNSSFEGLLEAITPAPAQMSSGTTNRGTSMVYKNDGTITTFLLEYGQNRITTSTDFFGTNGRLNYTKPAVGEDAYKVLVQMNNTTNEGIFRSAWEAGGDNDGASRVFMAKVYLDGSTMKGVAYFGYGPKFGDFTDSTQDWITKFYAHWVNGTSFGQILPSEKIQGQTFSLSGTGSTAKFVPVTSKIDYAAGKNAGTGTIYWRYANDGSALTLKTVDNLGSMTTLGQLGTIDSVTVPSYPKPD